MGRGRNMFLVWTAETTSMTRHYEPYLRALISHKTKPRWNLVPHKSASQGHTIAERNIVLQMFLFSQDYEHFVILLTMQPLESHLWLSYVEAIKRSDCAQTRILCQSEHSIVFYTRHPRHYNIIVSNRMASQQSKIHSFPDQRVTAGSGDICWHIATRGNSEAWW